jgi:hypothetical protein
LIVGTIGTSPGSLFWPRIVNLSMPTVKQNSRQRGAP